MTKIDKSIIFCIVVENRNPKLKAITEDFEDKAAMLTGEKP